MTQQHIQHRMPNPVNPLWVGLSLAAIAGMVGWYYYDQREKERAAEDEAPDDAEVIPPAAWNPDPNQASTMVPVQSGALHKAVFITPLTAEGEIQGEPVGDIPAYAVEYIPPDAFNVIDFQTSILRDHNGVATGAQGTVTFVPKTIDGQVTPAMITVEAPVPPIMLQLSLEISE